MSDKPKKEDLTISGYINKYGGIKSNLDDKVYTNKRDYEDHLKRHGAHIVDYKVDRKK
jgi:hypothetical protein